MRAARTASAHSSLRMRLSPSAALPIFTYRMSLDDEQRGPGDLTTIDSVLQVSDHRTLGYFDLLVVENVRSEKIGSDVAKTKRIVHRFLWQDGGYAAAK